MFEFALRQFHLPPGVPGRLFASPMPGLDDFAADQRVVQDAGIDRVVCLAPLAEVRLRAPDYAGALQAGTLPWEPRLLGIPDLGVPDDPEAFLDLARDIAGWLRDGESILIHCMAGIGRTGMLATVVLAALGLPLEQARAAVWNAGSGAETLAQQALEARIAAQLSPGA